MPRSRVLLALLLVALLTACSGTTPAAPAATSALAAAMPEPTAAPGASSGKLTVFAAASLTDAFKEIGKQFGAANGGASVTFNFAGSDQLAAQIAEGAPADVFASANRTQMNNVIESGQVIGGAERTFARNRLVVVYPKDNPGGLTALKDLAKPGLKIVLANKSVPVGVYALAHARARSKLTRRRTSALCRLWAALPNSCSRRA